MQLRFASFAVINLRRDLHPQECARAGRTRKKRPGRNRSVDLEGWRRMLAKCLVEVGVAG